MHQYLAVILQQLCYDKISFIVLVRGQQILSILLRLLCNTFASITFPSPGATNERHKKYFLQRELLSKMRGKAFPVFAVTIVKTFKLVFLLSSLLL